MVQPVASNSQSTLLAQLRDIHTADPVGIWPLAPGWWILFFILALLIVGLCVFYLRYRKANRWRKLAIAELDSIQTRHLDSASDKQKISRSIAELNQLMRRVYAQYTKNQEDAVKALSASPDAWNRLLAIHFEVLTEDERRILAYQHYAPVCDALPDQTFDKIRNWIRSL